MSFGSFFALLTIYSKIPPRKGVGGKQICKLSYLERLASQYFRIFGKWDFSTNEDTVRSFPGREKPCNCKMIAFCLRNMKYPRLAPPTRATDLRFDLSPSIT